MTEIEEHAPNVRREMGSQTQEVAMKRRTHPVQKGGVSPYQRHGKREYAYPAWVSNKRLPVPKAVLEGSYNQAPEREPVAIAAE